MSILPRMLGAVAALLILPNSLSAQEPTDTLVPELQIEEADPSEVVPAPAVPQATGEPGMPQLTRADVDAWLDGLMPYALKEADIAGAMVTVVKDGEILTSRGFGYADLENRVPVDGYETMFRPGSISKLFTWIAVMQEVEQGRIDLDADINTYLDFKIPEAFGQPITMRHLMTHTPGFQEKLRNLILGDERLYLSLEEFLKDTPPPARIFPPGETPAYSNYGTAVAGYVVQRVSGVPFEEYVETNIFGPLGMARATFRQPLPAEFEPYMSGGYNSASDGEAQYYELIPMGPAGALAADGESMGRFMIGLLERNPDIMAPETWDQMYNTFYDLSPPLNAMALGFWQLDKGNLRIRGHGGDTGFFHSDLNIMIDENVGIYVSVNSSGQGAGPLRFAVTTDFERRYFPAATEPVGERLATAKEHGALVAGTYESSRTIVTNFAAIMRFLGQETIGMNAEGDLVFSLFGKPSVWREVEPFVWRHIDGYERLTAVMTEDDKLDYITFEPVSPIIHLAPAPWYRNSGLIMPLLMLAIGILLITLVLWPVRAIVRWRYGRQFEPDGQEAMAYRLTRVGIGLVFLFLIAWILVFQTLMSNLSGLSGGFIAQLRVTQFIQLFLYAALAVAVWNIWVVWTNGQSWFAKVSSVLIALSILMIVFFAGSNGLLSLGTNF